VIPCARKAPKLWPATPSNATCIESSGSPACPYFRATTPDSLVKLQSEAWQPLLDWAAGRYGVTFNVAGGITFVEQPATV